MEQLRNWSISLVTRKTQIKTGLIYHLTHIKMVKIQNTGDSLYWGECGVWGTLLHCLWECKLMQPFWKSVWQFLRKLGINVSQDPAIPLLGIYPNDAHSYHKDICSTVSITALCVIARTWKQLGCCPSTKE